MAKAPYQLSRLELEELWKQLSKLLDVAFIRPSRSPYGNPILFQMKDSPKLRLCLDYYVLNKKTIKNQYPLPLDANYFDKLAKAKVFVEVGLEKEILSSEDY